MNEENVKCAKLILSKYFHEQKSDRVKAQEAIGEVKNRLPGLKKAEIKEARKRLGVISKSIQGEFYWVWDNCKNPFQVWTEMSTEMMRSEGK